ncbi:MAG: cell division protein ZapA [Denitrovibrio sp.]|nr:MAG: cell division protein ZapA [Denitrovibrio sp.]
MPVNEYKVRIKGMHYFIKTDKDLEYVNRVVEKLNERLSEIEQNLKAPDTQKLAVMAAFSFAAENMQLQEEKDVVTIKLDEIINKTA